MESIANQNDNKVSTSSSETTSSKKKVKIASVKPPPPLPTIEVNPNVELMAYGLAIILSAFSSSILCAASFSRTSLNFSMRVYTQLSVLIQATICLICLVAFGSMLAYLPKCVLASVVVSSVVSLITSGVAEGYFLWHIRRKELIEYLIIVIAPLIFGLSVGIGLGVLASVMLQFWSNSQAEIVELGGIQLPDERDIPGAEMKYVDIRRFPHAQLIKDVPVLEMRSELSFVNYRRLLDAMEERIHKGAKCMVVSMAHTYRLDTTALRQLTSFLKDIPRSTLLLHNVVNRGLFTPKNVNQFVTIHDAVLFCQSWLTKGPRSGVEFLPPICDENEELAEEIINTINTIEFENAAGQEKERSKSPRQKETIFLFLLTCQIVSWTMEKKKGVTNAQFTLLLFHCIQLLAWQRFVCDRHNYKVNVFFQSE
ncbi:sulfate transporter [Reticulomyxa filosa]|uniref:Sulfate transporter n=1 Tax=Reticulomyxa filosa TaxID=46433 RepID=X6MI16_RETFI|nr:sulfate transporter [Reticulomyxa filosa]|eukprot:ETO13296.1 sulfate transporter [Reticulomyxa filosa]